MHHHYHGPVVAAAGGGGGGGALPLPGDAAQAAQHRSTNSQDIAEQQRKTAEQDKRLDAHQQTLDDFSGRMQELEGKVAEVSRKAEIAGNPLTWTVPDRQLSRRLGGVEGAVRGLEREGRRGGRGSPSKKNLSGGFGGAFAGDNDGTSSSGEGYDFGGLLGRRGFAGLRGGREDAGGTRSGGTRSSAVPTNAELGGGRSGQDREQESELERTLRRMARAEGAKSRTPGYDFSGLS